MAGIIVAIFPSRNLLVRALDPVMNHPGVKIKKAAVVAKAKSGETVVLDDGLGPDEGGVAGGTLGAAMTALGLVQLGALALPGVGPVIALGAGALVGGLVGRATGRFASNLIDSGFKNEQIDLLAQSLEAGHPALVLEIENDKEALEILRAALKDYQAELVEPLHKVATGQLKPPPNLK
jgi:uncharacterized membrane protein